MKTALGIGLSGLLTVMAAAQTIYNTSPDWVSADSGVATGAALADIDRDGWLDLVVANGNDISRQRLAVYYNNGDGAFPPLPARGVLSRWRTLS